jgi:DNA-binding MarR family transcriptional regulator
LTASLQPTILRRQTIPSRRILALPHPEPDPLDGYDLDAQVGFLLRRAHQRHTALFADGMAAADLTPMQFSALVRIVALGRVTQNHLGRLVATDPATIHGVVRRLEGRGLVARLPDPGDRRTTVLAPTAAGLAMAAQAVPAARAITAATLAPLRPDERRQLLSLLRKVA